MLSYNIWFIPLIWGLLAVMTAAQLVRFWQEERTWKIAAYVVMFGFLGMLYLATTLEWGTAWKDTFRNIFIVALAVADWFQWRELITFLRKKDKKHAEQLTVAPVVAPTPVPIPVAEPVPGPERTTLNDLAASGNPVSLVATPTPVVAKEEQHV